MSPLGWLALAGVFVVASLPRAAAVRAGDLAVGGRLVAGDRRPGRPPARLVALARPVMVTAAVGSLAVVMWWGGPALTVAAAAATGVTALLVRDAVRARRSAARHRQLVTAVRVLAGELAAGARSADALAAAASVGPHAADLLGPAAATAQAGGDAADTLTAGAEPGARALGAAWRLGAATGAALAEVVERVAADLAAHDTRRQAVAVAVAGPRSSAVLLAGLPAIGVALGAAMGARPVDFLLVDPIGRVVCCVGVVLDAAGLLWIRRIVAGVQR